MVYCWIFLMCSSSSQIISEMILHRKLFILASSLCVTGDVRSPSPLRVARRGSEAYPPPALATVPGAGPGGSSPCVPGAAGGGRCAVLQCPRCSALPAEGNQPKNKIMAHPRETSVTAITSLSAGALHARLFLR